MEKIEITEQEKGVRLDIFLTELEPLSRSAIKNLITKGNVLVKNKNKRQLFLLVLYHIADGITTGSPL